MSNTRAIKPRINKFRPFFGFTEDDGTVSTGIGFVTYSETESGDETYQLTKLELGVRSDHIVDAVNKVQGNEVATRLVSDATDREVPFVGTVAQNEVAREQQADKQEAPAKDAPAAA